MSVEKYKKPTPQPKLNGAMGLTSEDLASSLGLNHFHLVEKLKRDKFEQKLGPCFKSMGWNFIVDAMNI